MAEVSVGSVADWVAGWVGVARAVVKLREETEAGRRVVATAVATECLYRAWWTTPRIHIHTTPSPSLVHLLHSLYRAWWTTLSPSRGRQSASPSNAADQVEIPLLINKGGRGSCVLWTTT